jgi:hypothetical protein
MEAIGHAPNCHERLQQIERIRARYAAGPPSSDPVAFLRQF